MTQLSSAQLSSNSAPDIELDASSPHYPFNEPVVELVSVLAVAGIGIGNEVTDQET